MLSSIADSLLDHVHGGHDVELQVHRDYLKCAQNGDEDSGKAWPGLLASLFRSRKKQWEMAAASGEQQAAAQDACAAHYKL